MDEQVLFRIYRVASRVLESEKMKKEIFSYQGLFPYIIAKIRLLWPSNWNIDLQELYQTTSFWEGVPSSLWAVYLWKATVLFNASSKLSIPHYFHQYLVEQFIFNSLPIRDITRQVTTMVNSNWAIWKLVNAHTLLASLSILLEGEMMFDDALLSEVIDYASQKLALEKSSEIDFVGLDDDMRPIMFDTINFYYKLIETLLTRESEQVNLILEDLILNLQEYLKCPGLISWFACSVTNCLMQIFLIRRFRPVSLPSVAEKSWLDLWREVKTFYLDLPDSSENDLMAAVDFAHYSSFTNIAIRKVRLNDENLIDVAEFISHNVREEVKLPYDWMNRIPITTSIIRPLIENCREQLPTLLVFLSERFVERNRYALPLLASDIQRILKIVRNSNDSKVLSGALIALSSSKFLRLAGAKLTLKMINADLTKADFAVPLFNLEKMDKEATNIKEIINEIAIDILKSPKNYAFKLTLAAASYLAQHSPVNFSPLLTLEHELKLYVSD